MSFTDKLTNPFGSDDEEATDEQSEKEEPTNGVVEVDEEKGVAVASRPDYDISDIDAAEPEDVDPSKVLPDGEDGRMTDEVSRLHKDFLASSRVEPDREMVIAGEQFIQSMWIEDWPQNGRPGFLRRIFRDAHYDSDISIHIDPREKEKAKKELKDHYETLKGEYQRLSEKGRDLDAKAKGADMEEAKRMHDLVSRTQMDVFDVSMYANFRAQSPEQLLRNIDDFKSDLSKPPADLNPQTATRQQIPSMVSTSPVAKDTLGKGASMMGGAVASLMPFASETLIEESGIDYGINPANGSPVIVDRFERDTGYNMLVIGNIGSGKSFSTGLQILRMMRKKNDLDVILLDPLNGFVGLNEALSGEHIVVGGERGLNPLEINETPEHVLEQADEKIDPYARKLKDVMAFFETFFAKNGSNLDSAERGVLREAIQDAYENNGITRNTDTHHKESPTILDVKENLREMDETPEDYAYSDAGKVAENIQDHAANLLLGLRPFSEDGEFANLCKQTEIDIDNRVTYLDLQQQESSGGTGLMMQILFNSVYEKAKTTDNNVVFVIDEAHYLMNDPESLDFLEHAVRHSRHYNLSIQFVTQTVKEFFKRDQAEAIANNCSMVQLNRVEGLDDELAQTKFGLNQKQAKHVRNAQAGDEDANFSESLLGVKGEGWRPLRIRAAPKEAAIVDFDPGEDQLNQINGYGESAVDREAREIEKALQRGLETTTQNTDDSAPDEISNLSRDELVELIKRGDFSSVDLNQLAESGSQTAAGGKFAGGDEITNSKPNETVWTEENKLESDAHVYHVRIATVSKDTDPEEYTPALEVLNSLRDGFEVFSTDPPEIALENEHSDETEFDTIVAAPVTEESFTRALYQMSHVDSAAVTDMTPMVDWSDIDLGDGTITMNRLQSAASDNDKVGKLFAEMKSEIDGESDDSPAVEMDSETQVEDNSGIIQDEFDEETRD